MSLGPAEGTEDGWERSSLTPLHDDDDSFIAPIPLAVYVTEASRSIEGRLGWRDRAARAAETIHGSRSTAGRNSCWEVIRPMVHIESLLAQLGTP